MLPNEVNPLMLGGGGYQISRSVRLRSSASAYFNRTAGTPTNANIWTWSGWVKRGTLTTRNTLFSGGSTNVNYICFGDSASTDNFGLTYANSPSQLVNVQSTAVFRDPSAWYHLMVVYDSTSATGTITGSATDRVRLYVNGVQITSFSVTTLPTQNTSVNINAAAAVLNLGRRNIASPDSYFDGYMTEVNFIDGQALTPSSFGEFDATTGVWKPKKYTGTYGTNGFYLNFSNNSAATAAAIGADYSGNGNNWTPTNISVTAGTTYDSMLDVPTPYADGGNGRGNYPVWNTLKKMSGNFTITDASMTASDSSASLTQCFATMRVPSTGKWYWEMTCVAGSGIMLSIGMATEAIADSNTPSGVGYYRTNGTIGNLAGAAQTAGATYTAGDVIGIAVDVDAGTVQFYKNNVSQGATPSFTFTAGTVVVPMVQGDNSAGTKTVAANFGQRPFAYTVPSGFKTLNTANLPVPTIKKGNAHFDVVTSTATVSTGTTVSSLAFSPGLMWRKNRNNVESHYLIDAVRGTGAGGFLVSNTTAAATDYPNADGTLTFNSNGYTIAETNWNAGEFYFNGRTYVDWHWNAGSSTVTNTTGTISAQVRANPTAGFSIITYTGTGANATVGHGLGVAPKMMIVKFRTGTNGWSVYHASANASPATGRILLDTAVWATDSLSWNNTLPTSSVFSLGTSPATNGSGSTYVAYCFAEVAGYSKIGSWQNNNSTDGAFVYLGFRPSFVMLKNYDNTEAWYIEDSKRQTYNYGPANTNFLNPNSTAIEAGAISAANAGIDFLSNGFKIRTTNTAAGEIGFGTRNYIYLAIAENPFKYSLAR